MTSTVRIDEEDKDRLKTLQDRWAAVHGQELSQKELLAKGLAYIWDHRDEFLMASGWRPLTSEEIDELWEDLVGHYGDWSSEDIDDIVYGDEAR